MGRATPIAVRRRRTELTLIVLAVIIAGAAYTLAALGKYAVLPPRLVPFLIAVLVMLVCAHLANRWLARGADGTLLPLAALLNAVGYVMIARLDDRLVARQTTWTFIGVGAYVLTLLLLQRVGDLARYQWTMLLGGAFLLMMPLIPGLGREVGGAKIWVRYPVGFQPGEFAKIALAAFFAAYLAERRELIATSTWRVGPFRLPEPRYLLPILFAWGFAVMVMVGEKDLGSSLLFFTLFVVMLWVATERATYLGLGFALFAAAVFVAWRTFDHVRLRVTLWFDPWKLYGGSTPATDRGRQAVQSWFAMADGGLAGSGLGMGSPTKIPRASTDYIFAAIGEELGMLGATAVIIAFLLLIGSGLRIALRAERPFEKLFATGLTTILGVQAFIIVAGVTRLLPLTGITLPFVSYGGSSLVANYVLIALLVRISDATARRSGEVPNTLTTGERWRAFQLRRGEKIRAKLAARRAKHAGGGR